MLGGDIQEALAVIHVDIHGSPLVTPNRTTGDHGWISMGLASPVADALYHSLSHYQLASLDMEHAQEFLFRIMYDAILASNKGVGLPIQMWQVTRTVFHELTHDEIEDLKNTVERWKDSEAQSRKAN